MGRLGKSSSLMMILGVVVVVVVVMVLDEALIFGCVLNDGRMLFWCFG